MAWKHITAFRCQSRQFRTEAKARKRQLVQTFLQETHHCCIRQDPAQWYQRIRRLCPAGRREGIHLRGNDDELLRPKESMQALHDFFSNLHRCAVQTCATPAACVRTLRQRGNQSCSCTTSHQTSRLANHSLNGGWKDIADALAEHMFNPLQACWCSNQPCHLPAAWHAATLCLLPKPGKPPKQQAGNLRPICIQHPACKFFTWLAAES